MWGLGSSFSDDYFAQVATEVMTVVTTVVMGILWDHCSSLVSTLVIPEVTL